MISHQYLTYKLHLNKWKKGETNIKWDQLWNM